jgi:hypothetical protein
VLIKANMVRGFEQGVTFLNMRDEDGIRVWVAEDNVILGPKRAWIVEGPRGNAFVFRNEFVSWRVIELDVADGTPG